MVHTDNTKQIDLSGFLETELDLLGATLHQEKNKSGRDNRGYNFLLADDNYDMLQYIGSILLSNWSEARIVYANNGFQAIEEMEHFQPDLIITDWDMPGKNGLAIAKEVNRDPEKMEIPILLVTGIELSPEARLRIKNLHIHSVLNKPFNSIKLIATVHNILNHHSSSEES